MIGYLYLFPARLSNCSWFFYLVSGLLLKRRIPGYLQNTSTNSLHPTPSHGPHGVVDPWALGCFKGVHALHLLQHIDAIGQVFGPWQVSSAAPSPLDPRMNLAGLCRQKCIDALATVTKIHQTPLVAVESVEFSMFSLGNVSIFGSYVYKGG